MSKKIISPLLTLFLFLSINIVAQKTKKTPEQRATQITNKMNKVLNLHPKQKVKVQAINLKYIRLYRVAKKNLKGKPEKLKQRRAKLNRNREKELQSVLTTEQYKIYRNHKKAAIEERKNKKHAATENATDSSDFDSFFNEG